MKKQKKALKRDSTGLIGKFPRERLEQLLAFN